MSEWKFNVFVYGRLPDLKAVAILEALAAWAKKEHFLKGLVNLTNYKFVIYKQTILALVHILKFITATAILFYQFDEN